MAEQDVALMAHLLRRAGFGASRDEIEAKAAQGYNKTVEEFLNPESQPEMELDLMFRLQPSWYQAANVESNVTIVDAPDDQQSSPASREDWPFSGTLSSVPDTARSTADKRWGLWWRCSGSTAWVTSGNCFTGCPPIRAWSTTWTTPRVTRLP